MRLAEHGEQEMAAVAAAAAVRWNVASDVVLAWIVMPAAALFGAAFYELYKFLS
jgi:PiT family inorganic phosphate transporter